MGYFWKGLEKLITLGCRTVEEREGGVIGGGRGENLYTILFVAFDFKTVGMFPEK